MVNLFNTILDMSVNAAVVICVIIVLRQIMAKAPKKFSYLIWSVAGFRLCCPVSFRSIISIFGIGQPDAPALPSLGGDIVLSQNGETGGGSIAIIGGAEHGVSQIADELKFIVTFNRIVMVIWFIGMAAVLTYAIVSYFKVRKLMANAIKYEANVYMSEKVGSPFTLGFIKPKIYIPFGLDASTQKQIIAHERCHIKRLDHIFKPLAFIMLAVHWFNPFCWVAFKLMSLDMELSCDETVLKQNGDEVMKKNYSRALLSFATNRRFPAPSPIAFSESNGNAKKRIKHALNFKKPKVWVSIICYILCALTLVACGADASTPRWKEVKTEAFGEEPYNIVYVSNGDGTCWVKEIRVDKDYEGDIHLIIPESAPNGDTVTEIKTYGFDSENLNVPFYLTEGDFKKIVGEIEDSEKEFQSKDEFGNQINTKAERAAKIIEAFYMLNADGYYKLEPTIDYKEKLRLSQILTAFIAYGPEECYEDTQRFLDTISDDNEAKPELARDAFKYLYFGGERVTEITFPESVSRIGYGSFGGCDNLIKVNGLDADDTIEIITENGYEFVAIGGRNVIELFKRQ